MTDGCVSPCARATGQHEYADEMLQRCLYALEMAWHPSFSPATASCRLPYSQEQNRPLFAALFKHMQALSRRGLHTTAFEVAKLLLMLDPDDPMGVMLCIDYFALRAHAYTWLQVRARRACLSVQPVSACPLADATDVTGTPVTLQATHGLCFIRACHTFKSAASSLEASRGRCP